MRRKAGPAGSQSEVARPRDACFPAPLKEKMRSPKDGRKTGNNVITPRFVMEGTVLGCSQLSGHGILDSLCLLSLHTRIGCTAKGRRCSSLPKSNSVEQQQSLADADTGNASREAVWPVPLGCMLILVHVSILMTKQACLATCCRLCVMDPSSSPLFQGFGGFGRVVGATQVSCLSAYP